MMLICNKGKHDVGDLILNDEKTTEIIYITADMLKNANQKQGDI